MEHPIDIGRMDVTRAFLKGKMGLNVGSANVRLKNKLNIDVVNKKHGSRLDLDGVASVLDLPFPDDSFEEIVFTEVLEHLPEGTEVRALRELKRVLKPNGLLVLSVPNGGLLNEILDPVLWLGDDVKHLKLLNGHRHYKREQLRELLTFSGLRIESLFTAGRLPWGLVTLTYTFNYLTRNKKINYCAKLVSKAFNGAIGEKGSTLFSLSRKIQ